MTVQSLLPPNGKPFLRAFEQAIAPEPKLIPSIDLIPDIKGRELPGWLKFLLYEYGLIELTPYVTNDYVLLNDGRIWQIERDTWAAVNRGLGWVSAPGVIAEAPSRRAWWNSFQLYLASLPPADVPNLERIDRVTELAKPFRSDFRRGVQGYDAPALETDTTKLDGSLLDRESGVRLRAGGPLWSFGRVHEYEHKLTRPEGEALGIWEPAISDAAFLVNFLTGEAVIGDDESATIEDATDFARASGKLAQAVDGTWLAFGEDERAITDRGLSIEPEATRLSQFWLDTNPVDDDIAADVLLTSLADAFGGNTAFRVQFSDAGWLLYVPADGIEPATTYGVSFFAKLISASGLPPGGFFGDLALGAWVRIEGTVTTPALLDGQWLDISLLMPGATVVVDLCGFQVEADRVTSPIAGNEITAVRAADELTISLPGEDQFNLTITFDDGAAQPLLSVVGDTPLDPSALIREYVREIGSLRVGTWESMAFPWEDADFPWNGDAVSARARSLAAWFEANPEAHFRLKAAGGAVIGYRRVRVVRQSQARFNGPLRHGAARFAASDEGTVVYIDAMTDAGNGQPQAVASVDLLLGGTPAPGIPPGRLWLAPGELSGGTAIAPKFLSIPLRATVRERIKVLLRF